MKYYKHSETGDVFSYESEQERQEWGAPELVEMTPEEIEAHLNPPPAPPSVPRSITMRQARRCLRLHGLLDAVQPAIDSLPEPDRTDAQIDWDYSATVERERGFVLVIAQALGISDEQLDALFIEAATL